MLDSQEHMVIISISAVERDAKLIVPSQKKIVMDSGQIGEALDRIASSILSASEDGVDDLVLVGIRTGGAFLSHRLTDVLTRKSGVRILNGVIDITLYRDDWTKISSKPILGKTELNFSIDNKRVVLVDDVLFTGRTVRAAMDALIDFGRPSKIELAVLADRGYRELPICANYIGITIHTTLRERVNVYLAEMGYADEVAVENNGQAEG